jgi:hypothetical protein
MCQTKSMIPTIGETTQKTKVAQFSLSLQDRAKSDANTSQGPRKKVI